MFPFELSFCGKQNKMYWTGPSITGYLAICVAQAFSVPRSKITAPYAKLISKVDDDAPISLQIGLKLQNLDQLESRLMAVSTPGSQEYGQYWDFEQVTDAFYPSAQASNAVKRWLDAEGVRYAANNGPYITIMTTVKTANTLLNASYAHYAVDGVTKLRTMEYSVPDEVHQYIDLVHPTTYFGRARRRPEPDASLVTELALINRATDNCTLMTPENIRKLYNIHYTPNLTSGSRVGFGSFLNHSSNLTDLRLYQTEFKLSGPASMSVQSINGGLEQLDPATRILEPNLDSQMINSVSHPLPITEFVTGGSPPFVPDAIVTTNNNEPYLEYYQYLMSKQNSELPQVISNSYGEDERTVPEEYARRVCNYIGLMGLRGITVIECTGDWGVGAACLSNDGKNRLEFDPQFPASCPYVTAVGGTQGASGSASTCLDGQEAWFASSGGFSKYFRRPWYQEDAVDTYLDQHINPETKKYYSNFANFGGRGFPDISAHSLYPS
jgi:tripeptidyl-peptidase I